MNRIIKSSASKMFQRQTSILSAAGVLMITAIGGAALGLVKLHLSVGLLNPGTEGNLDAYRFAFLIPDFIFNIVVLGALNAAFIPVFGQLVHRNKEEESWKTLSSMINNTALLFGVIALLTLLLADWIVPIFTPGFSAEQQQLTINLTKLLMLSPILLGVSAFLTGAIQVHHRFLIPALAPFLYNLGAIFGILVLYPQFGVYGLAYGILIGSALHFLIQVPVIHMLGFRYRTGLDWKNEATQRIAKLTIPRSIGLGVDRMEVVVTSTLLTTLAGGALYLFGAVQTLIAFPISLFGVSIAQAALPTLTKEAKSSINDFRQTLLDTFLQILYLVVPTVVLLVVLRLPIIRVVYNLDEWSDTLQAAQVLLLLAPAVLAQSVIHLWARASFALEDSKAPLIAGGLGALITITLSILTLNSLGTLGIAFSMTIGSFVTMLMLILFVYLKIGEFGWNNFFGPLLRIFASGAIMGATVYWPVKPMESTLFDTSKTVDLILLSIMVSGFGLGIYLFISWILGSKEIVIFIKVAHRLRSWREALAQSPATYTNVGVASDMHSTD